jgi:guanine deaminase
MSGVELFRASLFHTRGNPADDERAFVWHEDGGLLVGGGRIIASGAFTDVRRSAPDASIVDWRGGLLLPGFVDAHVHYPQLRIIGALGRTLLDWLEHSALPEEARLHDVAYAIDVARRFVRALADHGTTTALVFGAHFAEATAALFDAGAAAGLRIVSGLVVSDRALRPDLHQTVEAAYRDSTELIRRFHGHGRALYAVTPRFALSTSEAMLEMCQTLALEHPAVRVQSHINENRDEVAAVRAAFPWAGDYLAVYERFSLTGSLTVLAHDVHPTQGELERLAAAGTSIAHCPASNAALGSGIFPLQRHVDAGVHVALGTDVGAGTGFGMGKEALCAHLMQRVAPQPVSLDPRRLLYLATLAGARALGLDREIGSLCPGKAADFIYLRPADGTVLDAVLDRSSSPEQMLGAVFALAGPESIREVRVDGAPVSRRESRAAPAP